MIPNPYEPRLVRSLDSYLQHGHAASAGRACGADPQKWVNRPLSPGTVTFDGVVGAPAAGGALTASSGTAGEQLSTRKRRQSLPSGLKTGPPVVFAPTGSAALHRGHIRHSPS